MSHANEQQRHWHVTVLHFIHFFTCQTTSGIVVVVVVVVVSLVRVAPSLFALPRLASSTARNDSPSLPAGHLDAEIAKLRLRQA